MLPSYEETLAALRIPEAELKQLQQVHKRKLRTAINWFWISAVITIAVCFIVYGVAESDGLWPILTLVLSLFCLIRIFSVHAANKRAYRLDYKHKVVGPLADTMLKLAKLPHETRDYEKYCDYAPEAFIDRAWISKSELFVTDIDDITGEDLFTGKYGLTEFQFSELKMTRKETTTDTDGNSTTTNVKVYDGVLFAADFKKHFSGLTVINTKVIKRDTGIGKLVSKFINAAVSTANKRANQKIELENVEFNRHFIVQTTNEIEARYILSSVLMEQILSFVNQHPHPLVISFHDSYMFIAVYSSKNFFDDGIGKSTPNGEYNLQGIYNDLSIFFRIIEEFDLNTRIWNK